jgi:hypothetical protein
MVNAQIDIILSQCDRIKIMIIKADQTIWITHKQSKKFTHLKNSNSLDHWLQDIVGLKYHNYQYVENIGITHNCQFHTETQKVMICDSTVNVTSPGILISSFVFIVLQSP